MRGHAVEIIKEFADHGKSGLSLKGRDAFNEMLKEYVIGGQVMQNVGLVA